MEYKDSYSSWLWKIHVVTDESDLAEDFVNTVTSLLETLKDPPDVECYSVHEKSTEKCRKVLFVLDKSKLTEEAHKAIMKWLQTLLIDPRKSEKYMVLLVTSEKTEGSNVPLGGLNEREIVIAKDGVDIFTWWPKVITFLCKTRNWDNSAYILLHAGFGHDVDDAKKMIKEKAKIEEQKKIIEVMLGQFGPRTLHRAHWNGGSSRPVTATDVNLLRFNALNSKMEGTVTNNLIPKESLVLKQHIVPFDDSSTLEENHLTDPFIANYLSEEPLKPSWTEQKSFAAVVPIFILLKPDITVAEKCCLADYAREFPKTHFLCISDCPPSEYTKLVSSNIYGSRDLIEFIFNLLKELKVISSIKSKKRDSCVCTLM